MAVLQSPVVRFGDRTEERLAATQETGAPTEPEVRRGHAPINTIETLPILSST